MVMRCGSSIVLSGRAAESSPSKGRALPDTPATQDGPRRLGPLLIVPSRPARELSCAIAPLPSSNRHWAVGSSAAAGVAHSIAPTLVIDSTRLTRRFRDHLLILTV